MRWPCPRRATPCSRRGLQFALSVASVKSVEFVRQSRRGVPSGGSPKRNPGSLGDVAARPVSGVPLNADSRLIRFDSPDSRSKWARRASNCVSCLNRESTRMIANQARIGVDRSCVRTTTIVASATSPDKRCFRNCGRAGPPAADPAITRTGRIHDDTVCALGSFVTSSSRSRSLRFKWYFVPTIPTRR
jgi:hypothetical protein